MESSLPDPRRALQTYGYVLQVDELTGDVPEDDEHHLQEGGSQRMDSDQITPLDATAQHAHTLTTVVDEKVPINLSTTLSAINTSKKNSTPPKQKSNNSKNTKCDTWRRQCAFFQSWRVLTF